MIGTTSSATRLRGLEAVIYFNVMRPAIVIVSVLILLGTALLGCRPSAAPPAPPDFTILKRDLLELDQSLSLSRRTGVAHPDRYIAALEQLERDYRLQRDKPTGEAQTGVELAISVGRKIRETGNRYAYYAGLHDDARAEQWWTVLTHGYLILRPSPEKDLIDLAVQSLEAAEQPIPQK
jgi:hypothetical protein